MEKRTIGDVHDILCKQLEKLSAEDLSVTDLQMEIERSKNISRMAQTIVNNLNLGFKVQKYKDNGKPKETKERSVFDV